MAILLFVLLAFAGVSAHGQQNLAATAQASASASSTGNFGPANWTDGIKNGSFFGWVGTASNFPQPAWMQLQWSQPQTFNRIRLFHPGTNFQPPAGNAVVFAGSMVLQYWNGMAWLNHDTLTSQGTFGDSVTFNFPSITTTRIRLTHFVLNGAPNPGFDEWEVYNVMADTTDLAVVGHNVENIFGGIGRTMRVRMRIRNLGNVPVVNPTLSWKVNTTPETGPYAAMIPLILAPGADTLILHPETTAAVQALNGRELCMWVRTNADSNFANDTLCVALAGFGSSVASLDGSQGLSLYPNPSMGRLQLAGLPDVEWQYALYDMQGRRLMAGIWPESGLDLPAFWVNSTYFLMLESAEKRFGGPVILRR